MSKLEEMKEKIKETKKVVIKKTKEKLKNAQDSLSTGAVKVATVATLASGVGGLGATEAQAQSNQGSGSGRVTEIHFSSNGQTTVKRERTADFSTARAQQATSQTYHVSSRGMQARGLVYNNVPLQYSPAYSDGLSPEVYRAYVNPTESNLPYNRQYVYYSSITPEGREILSVRITKPTADQRYEHGTSQYCIPHDRGMGAYGGGYGGVVYREGDEWDRTLDDVNHTMDQVDYAIGTAMRIGDTVADVLHEGNRIGGRIQHEVRKGTRKAPSGPHRSPSGRYRGGR